MMIYVDIGKKIRKLLKNENRNIIWASEKLGIHHSAVKRKIDSNSFSAQELMVLAAYTGIDLNKWRDEIKDQINSIGIDKIDYSKSPFPSLFSEEYETGTINTGQLRDDSEDKGPEIIKQIVRNIREGNLSGYQPAYVVTVSKNLYDKNLNKNDYQYIANQVELGHFSGKSPIMWALYCTDIGAVHYE